MRRGCHVFPSERFSPKSPQNNVSEPFRVSEMFSYQKFLDSRGIKILSILFVSQYQKICVQPSNDSKKLGHPKFLCTKVEVNDFPWINFGLTVPKNFMGERFCVSENFQYGNNLWRRGGVTFSCRELFVQNRRRKSRAKPSVFQNCSGIKNFLDNRDIRILSIFFVPHRQKSS